MVHAWAPSYRGILNSERKVLARMLRLVGIELGEACAMRGWERTCYARRMNDTALWAAFAVSSLTPQQWAHETHVRTAFLFSQRFDIDEAHLRLRAGIIRLNERHGLVETSARGYFETLTRAWLVLVSDARRRTGALTSTALLTSCPELMDRGLALRHYSKGLLGTARARAIFVEPDLSPLPYVP
jgi:hypothetical protein